jgi:hypothetical protein
VYFRKFVDKFIYTKNRRAEIEVRVSELAY